VYETADPGKFPEDVEHAIGITPPLPPGMRRQATLPERVYHVIGEPEQTAEGLKLSNGQAQDAKAKIREIFR
jgi:threonine synthase